MADPSNVDDYLKSLGIDTGSGGGNKPAIGPSSKPPNFTVPVAPG